MNSPQEDLALRQYLRDIKYSRPYTREEEYALAKRIKQGDLEARNKLVEANTRFVITIASEYKNCGLPFPDLVSEGNIGLIIAADRFDEKRGCKFISYAVWWIKQAILGALKQHPSTIRLPANVSDEISRVEKASRKREQETEDSTHDLPYLAKELNLSEERIAHILNTYKKTLSLDSPKSEDDKRSLLEKIADSNQSIPGDSLDAAVLREKIEQILPTLKEREQEVLKSYYGLNGTSEQTLEEIGNRLGVTRERIRQIKEKALEKLRYPSRAKKLLPYLEE